MQFLPVPQPPDEQPWASPFPGETAKWFHRASLFFAMGACRSVRAVYNAELAERGRAVKASKPVPGSWHQASHRYEWLRRADAFDAWRRKEIFATGNAQDTERIKKLDGLIERLSSRCLAIIDSLDMATIDAEGATKLITALLSALDLMAKHAGGYPASKVEITGKDGKAIEIEETQVSVVFYAPEIDDGALDALPSDGSNGSLPGTVDAE